jgi:multiple sugar transport system ATP-binding protein
MALYYNPINRFVAGFIGSPKMNFLPARVEQCGPAGLVALINDGEHRLQLPSPIRQLQPGDEITLGIRPEQLQINGDAPLNINFHCEVVERLGNNTYLFGQSHGHDGFKMLLPGDVHFRPYQTLRPTFHPHHCMVFDAEGARISADIAMPQVRAA